MITGPLLLLFIGMADAAPIKCPILSQQATTTFVPQTSRPTIVSVSSREAISTTVTGNPVALTSSSVSNTSAVSCNAKWKAQNYPHGSLVSENGVNFHSKFYTSSEPQINSDSAWVNDGPCDVTSLTFRPFVKPGVIGYWANWAAYTRPQNNIDQLDLSGFSAVNYAFVNALADGSLKSFDEYADGMHIGQLNGAVRSKYPNLRTVVSIGGWSGSRFFSNIASDPAIIQAFAKNVHAYLDENGFDGVDIDWEHPGGGGLSCNQFNTQDAKNYATLLQSLRTELGPTRLISIAASADISHYIVDDVNYVTEYAKYISYFQVMTYDFYGSWSPYTDFNSPLNSPGTSDPQEPGTNAKNGTQFSISSSMQRFVGAGIPKSQLVPGLAFYGRSWQVASQTNNGLYQPCAGPKQPGSDACVPITGDVLDAMTSPDACGGSYHSSVWMYMNLRGDTRGKQMQADAPLASGPSAASNGWTRNYFSFAETPTLFHPNYNGAPTFIAYDDPQSIQAKSSWSKSEGFAGVMVWELDQDYQGEMIGALRAGWGL